MVLHHAAYLGIGSCSTGMPTAACKLWVMRLANATWHARRSQADTQSLGQIDPLSRPAVEGQPWHLTAALSDSREEFATLGNRLNHLQETLTHLICRHTTLD